MWASLDSRGSIDAGFTGQQGNDVMNPETLRIGLGCDPPPPPRPGHFALTQDPPETDPPPLESGA